MTEVTFLSVFFAAIAAQVIGFAWYSEYLFGKVWIRMMGVSPEMVEAGKKKMPLNLALALLSAMVMAYVLNHFGVAWGVYDAIGAFELAFWSWLGFAAPILLGSVLWEQKPFGLYAINALYWLVSMAAMAFILVL